MHIRGMTKINMGLAAQAVAVSMIIAVFAGCASVFKLQVLYEAPPPGAADSTYVMRL